MKQIRIGLLDTGLSPTSDFPVVARQAFFASSDGGIRCAATVEPANSHAQALATVMHGVAPEALLLDAQVFTGQFRQATTTPALVAAGLDWLLEQGVAIVNMSFGLRHDREVLREACANASVAEVLMVASAPARGPAVFPASYPGVISVSGDARCADTELSALDCRAVAIGACPRLDGLAAGGQQPDPAAGASIACARVSALLAHWLASGGRYRAARAYLRGAAKYCGREQKR